MYVELMFAGTNPPEPEQNYETGRNDLYSAVAARFFYTFDNKPMNLGYDRKWGADFEIFL